MISVIDLRPFDVTDFLLEQVHDVCRICVMHDEE